MNLDLRHAKKTRNGDADLAVTWKTIAMKRDRWVKAVPGKVPKQMELGREETDISRKAA